MASIRKLAENWQIRFYSSERSPQRKPITYPLGSYTRTQIEKKKTELEYKYNEGLWDPWTDGHPGTSRGTGQSPRLKDALEDYFEHKRRLGRRGQRGGWSAETYRRRTTTLGAFGKRAGEETRVSALTTDDFAAWIFRPRLSEASSRTYRRHLKTFVSWLREERGAEVAPLPRPMQPERERIRDYPTEEDLHAIVEAHRERLIEETKKKYVPKSGPKSPIWTLGYRMAFRLSFYQGLRLGEIVQLVPDAVDVERQRLAVGLGFVPKGRHEKVITITPPAKNILKHLANRARRKGWKRLFGLKRGKRLSDAFRAARRRVFPAREELNFKSLRRGATVFWLERGLSERDMRNILRHASERVMRQHYDQHIASGVSKRINEIYESEEG